MNRIFQDLNLETNFYVSLVNILTTELSRVKNRSEDILTCIYQAVTQICGSVGSLRTECQNW